MISVPIKIAHSIHSVAPQELSGWTPWPRNRPERPICAKGPSQCGLPGFQKKINSVWVNSDRFPCHPITVTCSITHENGGSCVEVSFIDSDDHTQVIGAPDLPWTRTVTRPDGGGVGFNAEVEVTGRGSRITATVTGTADGGAPPIESSDSCAKQEMMEDVSSQEKSMLFRPKGWIVRLEGLCGNAFPAAGFGWTSGARGTLG